jgi:putative peptide zinc metalloprotease protein
MQRSYLSPHWHRVAKLRLRVRAHVRMHRMRFRGGLWYVLQDRVTGRFHRLTPETQYFVSLLDGKRTVQEAWDIAAEALEDEVLTQDEAIRLIGQLHAADILYGDTPPDIGEVATRGRRMRRRKLTMSLLNPLALRLPLFDPEEFLNATAPLARIFFSWFGALLWLGVMIYGGATVVLHWGELADSIADRLLATENIVLLLLAYPVVKALHELGHAYAMKRFGGELHEVGIMFLVFMPVPYVDASDSAAFASKWERALVGAAGILVELFLAALAAIVWVNAESGMVSAFAFAVMLIGGVSTLFFNGNPLLRFDGYYVMADVLEIPNLASRSNQYLGYLIQKHLFDVEDARSPATAAGEAKWFVFYSIAAFVYRIFIMIAIALFVGTQFFFVGVLIAIWGVVLMFGVPGFKMLKFLFTSPVLRRRRGRALSITGAGVAALGVALVLIPLPHSTVAQGIVWPAPDMAIHAGEDGFVVELLVPEAASVSVGTPLMRVEDPQLAARARLLEARIGELERRLAVLDLVRPAEARIAAEELRQARAEFDSASERLANLVVRSPAAGQVAIAAEHRVPGRFVRRGELLGYVLRQEGLTVRVAIPEQVSDLALERMRGLDLRFASDVSQTLPARLVRITPTLTTVLPSRALSSEGGGPFPLDPTDPAGERTFERLLHLDVAIDGAAPPPRIAERAHLRVRLDPEPLAKRIYRSARQVFLRHFQV